MGGIGGDLALVFALVLVNAAFAGSEMALVSLRDGQLRRLEGAGRAGATLARLARDPGTFLATIQIGITLAGFMASASAAVSLARPVEAALGFLGSAAGPVSVMVVTIVLAYVTLVLGELAPKRIAMQRAERWGLVAARPLSGLARVATPAVWALSRSADLVVRVAGADPDAGRDEVTTEELRELLSDQTSMSDHQRTIIDGAFEVAGRTVAKVLRPRREVIYVDADSTVEAAIDTLVSAGHSRAPVAVSGDLDDVVGIVSLRGLLLAGTGPVAPHATDIVFCPETATVLDTLHVLQTSRQQMAVVVNEHGGTEGIVTVEDLVEELVGEIYDESDRDVLGVSRDAAGSMVLPGRYPAHDLDDIGVIVADGPYATVAGLVLAALGRVPEAAGDVVDVDGWRFEVLALTGRAITEVKVSPIAPPEPEAPAPAD